MINGKPLQLRLSRFSHVRLCVTPRTAAYQAPSSLGFSRQEQVVLVVKKPTANARDTRDAGLIPGLGRSPGGGNGKLLQNSCLENPTDREAWQAIIHRVTVHIVGHD